MLGVTDAAIHTETNLFKSWKIIYVSVVDRDTIKIDICNKSPELHWYADILVVRG